MANQFASGSMFAGRWFASPSPVERPLRSSDLTPPDFFLRAALKKPVYAEKSKTVVGLEHKIWSAVHDISQEICMKVCRSVSSRLHKYLEVNGVQMELS